MRVVTFTALLAASLAAFLDPALLLSAPITLSAPWDSGEVWQPSTYSGHGNALDFNKVINIRSTCPYADSVGNGDEGEAIRAAHGGSIRLWPYHFQYGNYVDVISDTSPYFTRYAHLQFPVEVNPGLFNGEYVAVGDIIGRCGLTGNGVTGAHLHFELRNASNATVPIDRIQDQPVVMDTNCRDPNDSTRWFGIPIKTTTTFSVTVTYAALGLHVPDGTNVTWGPYTRQTTSGIALFVNLPCATHDLSVSGFWVVDQSFGAYASCGTTQTAKECERGDCTTEATTVAEGGQVVASAGFVIDDRVEVYNTGGIGLRAWNDICSNGYVVKQEGARGLVLDGPQCCNGYDRWQIRWDGESVARWSAEGDQATGEYWLRNVSVPVVSAPTITPNGGAFTGPVQIDLSTPTSGATITFTTTGADPTINSASYGGPFFLNASATIKARAFKSGYSDSSISAAAFIITPPSNQILYVSTTSVDVGSGAGSAGIFVHNDGSGSMIWTATEDCPWVTNVTPTGTSLSQWDDDTLSMSYDENPSTSPRSCPITISAPGATGSPKTLILTQAGTCGGTGVVDLVPLEGYLVDAETLERLTTLYDGQEIRAALSFRIDVDANYCVGWSGLWHDAWFDGVYWNGIVQPADEVCAISNTMPGSKTYLIMTDDLHPWTVTAGEHTVRIVLNPYNQITERNRCNNSIDIPFSVAPLDLELPTVVITVPTTEPVYRTPIGLLDLAGTSADNLGVASITWANDRGGSGSATGTDNWSATGILLDPGINLITVTARDFSSNTGSATLVVDAICVGPKADFDCDGDVDPADFGLFQPCMFGPNESLSLGCAGSDLDGDADLDLLDFAEFQLAFSGCLTQTPSFADDFNRPDGPVGNGWLNPTGDMAEDLVIRSGALSTPSTPGPHGRAGVYRPIDISASVTISATLTHMNGYGGLLNRYDVGFLFGSTGDISSGYGVGFARGDQNYSDSRVNLSNGAGSVSLPSSFQFGASVTTTFTFSPDGSINGLVTDGVSTFDFSVGPGPVTLPASNFAISQGFPDERSSVITNPSVDNLSITYSCVAP